MRTSIKKIGVVIFLVFLGVGAWFVYANSIENPPVQVSVPPPEYRDSEGILHHTSEVYQVTYTYKGITESYQLDFAINPPTDREEIKKIAIAGIQENLGQDAAMDEVEYTLVKINTEKVY